MIDRSRAIEAAARVLTAARYESELSDGSIEPGNFDLIVDEEWPYDAPTARAAIAAYTRAESTATTIRIALAAVGGAAIMAFLWWNDVPTEPTLADRAAAKRILAPTYEDELALIGYAQRRVLEASPIERGIPKGQPREPSDLLRIGQGLCFDRSRAIEKVLAAVGFETRHVAIYGDAMATILPGRESHAMSEVKTQRGWLLVDSVTPWRAIDADGAPIEVETLNRNGTAIAWQEPMPEKIHILRGDFVHLIGLYSRHGQYYPPYAPFPDVAWPQLISDINGSR